MTSEPSDNNPAWDTVHHISNYYDGPLEGLANLNGAPHVFFLHDEIFRQVGTLEDPDVEVDRIYALHAVSDEMARGLMEKQAIFERWHQAWSQDRSLMEHHPALPADRERHDALRAELAPQLDSLRRTKTTQVLLGEFHSNRRPVAPGCSRWGSYEVKWRAQEA
jgi:hypothetical protein